MSPRAELVALERAIATVPSAIVAFSGGVDSSLVAAASARVLGDRAVAVTAVSPALAKGELDGARSVAAAVGIVHRTITTDELSREGYRRNGDGPLLPLQVGALRPAGGVGRRRGLRGRVLGGQRRRSRRLAAGVACRRRTRRSAPAHRVGVRKVRRPTVGLGARDPERRQAGDAVPCVAAALRHAGRPGGPRAGRSGGAGGPRARVPGPAGAAPRHDRARGAGASGSRAGRDGRRARRDRVGGACTPATGSPRSPRSRCVRDRSPASCSRSRSPSGASLQRLGPGIACRRRVVAGLAARGQELDRRPQHLRTRVEPRSARRRGPRRSRRSAA